MYGYFSNVGDTRTMTETTINTTMVEAITVLGDSSRRRGKRSMELLATSCA